jgi:hypothetical protein
VKLLKELVVTTELVKLLKELVVTTELVKLLKELVVTTELVKLLNELVVTTELVKLLNELVVTNPDKSGNDPVLIVTKTPSEPLNDALTAFPTKFILTIFVLTKRPSSKTSNDELIIVELVMLVMLLL